jgi:hypothetical protein
LFEFEIEVGMKTSAYLPSMDREPLRPDLHGIKIIASLPGSAKISQFDGLVGGNGLRLDLPEPVGYKAALHVLHET